MACSNAFSNSLGCEKLNYWNAFNHPKLEKETYIKFVHNEDGPVIKLKGYVYYINLNQYIFDECNIPIVEPIFYHLQIWRRCKQ